MRTKHTEVACPNCKTMLGESHALDGEATPSEGDITICAHCSENLIFGENMTLSIANADELSEVCLLEISKAHRVVKKFQIWEKNHTKKN